MDFDLFKPKAPPLFGLDISSSSVKMLEIVEAGRGAYRVERYAIEPLMRDTVVDGNISNLEQAADAVKRAHKRLGTRTRRPCRWWCRRCPAAARTRTSRSSTSAPTS